jgi:hypothetical protein
MLTMLFVWFAVSVIVGLVLGPIMAGHSAPAPAVALAVVEP